MFLHNLLFGIGFSPLLIPPDNYFGKDIPSLEQVFKVWREREKRIHSFKIIWRQKRIIFPGFLNRPGLQVKEHSSEPLILENQQELWMKGNWDKFITRKEKTAWSPEKGDFIQFDNFVTYNGKYLKGYMDIEEELSGSYSKKDTRGKFIGFIPITGNYRPFHYWKVNPDKFKLVKEIGIVDEKKCLILEENDPANFNTIRWWVVPEYDFQIGKWQQFSEGRILAEIITSYEKKDSMGWVPKSWKSTVYQLLNQTEKFGELIQYDVISISLNIPLDDSDFDLVFPPRTLVSDNDNNKSYLVLQDGQMQELSPKQLTLNYKELMRESFTSSKMWLFWLFISALVFIIIFFILKKFKLIPFYGK